MIKKNLNKQVGLFDQIQTLEKSGLKTLPIIYSAGLKIVDAINLIFSLDIVTDNCLCKKAQPVCSLKYVPSVRFQTELMKTLIL